MQSPSPGEKQPQAPVHSGGHPDGRQLTEKDLGVPVDTKLNMNQQHTLPTEQTNRLLGCIRQILSLRSGDPSPLLSSGEVTPRVLCPDLGSPVHQRCENTGGIPMKGH